MWVKQCHKPPMTENGNHTTYKMVMTGGWFIIVLSTLMWIYSGQMMPINGIINCLYIYGKRITVGVWENTGQSSTHGIQHDVNEIAKVWYGFWYESMDNLISVYWAVGYDASMDCDYCYSTNTLEQCWLSKSWFIDYYDFPFPYLYIFEERYFSSHLDIYVNLHVWIFFRHICKNTHTNPVF